MDTVVSTRKITNPEGRLLEILHEASPIVWQHYGHRFPTRLVDGQWKQDEEESKEPPFISFRFKEESEELINRLRYLVENYQGVIKWDFYRRKRLHNLPGYNCIIRPLRIHEVEALGVWSKEGLSPGQYLAKYEPQLARVAFADLNALTKYIEENLKK